jgi:hypothetical protein
MQKTIVIKFIIITGLVLVPLAAFGMQVLSDAEMDSIKARTGVAQTIEGMALHQHDSNDNDAPVHPASDNSRDLSGTKVNPRPSGSGVAIFINDVVIFSGGRYEIWYQNGKTSG